MNGEVLNTHETAAELGLTYYRIGVEIREGRLRATRDGHAYRITRTDFDAYLADRGRRCLGRPAGDQIFS